MQVNGDRQLSFIICGLIFADGHIRIGKYIALVTNCKIMKKTHFHQTLSYKVLSPTDCHEGTCELRWIVAEEALYLPDALF